MAPSDVMKQSLRVYQLEPIGRLLRDRLRLPLLVIWALFAFMYFGILLVLHNAVGTPGPATVGDVFRQPSGPFYYPNLIGITYDLIGNPLQLTLLVLFRSYIPHQLAQLRQSDFIREKPRTSRMDRFLHLMVTSSRAHTLLVIIYPALATVLGTVVAALASFPKGMPSQYALFLTVLSIYGRAAVFVQLIYIFVILGNYQLDFRLHLNHPDRCSGLSPFGRLSIGAYSYLFIFALMLAFGTLAGGTPLGTMLRSAKAAGSLFYLWLLFPLAVVLIFVQLIYRPHCVLRELQRQHLLTASVAWTNYHQQLMSSISETAEHSTAPLASKGQHHFSDDLELLEVWAKLNKFVENMHTWPIPRRTFRIIAVIVNPLVPILMPVAADLVKNILP